MIETISANFLSGVIAVLFLSLAIFIHELGHFLAAKWFGLQIDVFSIGFGPALWKKKINGVEYKIGCIPLGGYVALPQLDPSGMETIQGEQGEKTGAKSEAPAPVELQLPDIAAWKRVVVAIAGPFGNIVLAFLLALIIYWIPSGNVHVVDTRVGMVVEKSEAWDAGLRQGDRILEVNGEKVNTWIDMMVENVLSGNSGKAMFKIDRAGEKLTLEIPFTKHKVMGIYMLEGVYSEFPCQVDALTPGAPAEKAGLKPGDVLLSVAGVPVWGGSHFIELIKKNGVAEVDIGVRRGSELLTFRMAPQMDEEKKRPLLGVQFSLENSEPWMQYRNPIDQLKWDALSVFRVLRALLFPRQKGESAMVAKSIGGPAEMMIQIYNAVQGGFMDALGFLRMICVNLAILNLLPIPVLDGGHVMFASYEIITRRKPHPKVVSTLVTACAVVLISLMIFLLGRDIYKRVLLSQMRHAQEEQVEKK
jgi:regulator of sigma E protease